MSLDQFLVTLLELTVVHDEVFGAETLLKVLDVPIDALLLVLMRLLLFVQVCDICLHSPVLPVAHDLLQIIFVYWRVMNACLFSLADAIFTAK